MTKPFIKILKQFIVDLGPDDESGIVVFGKHIHLLKEVAKATNSELLIGGLSPIERNRIKHDFMDGKFKVLPIQFGVGGEGLDGLQHRANKIFWSELPWSPWDVKQQTGRVARPGQKSPIVSRYFCSNDTKQTQRVFEIVYTKQQNFKDFYDGRDVI